MPVHGRPYEKGNLYIHFKVVFPEELSQEQVGALQIRPARPQAKRQPQRQHGRRCRAGPRPAEWPPV